MKAIVHGASPEDLGIRSESHQECDPSKITDSKKADLAIEIWDCRIGKLDSECGETWSSKVNMAVLCAMLP